MAKGYRPARSRRDLIYVGSANFQVKPINKKYSWTEHFRYESAVAETQSSVRSREQGRHTRRLYRVNVYLKRKALENKGLLPHRESCLS